MTERKTYTPDTDELAAQAGAIEWMRRKNAGLAVKPKAHIKTYGCQMNVHDSETLLGLLTAMGYGETAEETDADLVIYNTCCVRENAENKVYGNLGFLKHIKKDKPHLKIALCGCMMQQDTVVANIQKQYAHVDIIFGTFNLHRFPQLLQASWETGGQIADIWEDCREIVDDLPAKRESPVKASVNIMYGCNNFCTYCIVPYVRGRERSRAPENIFTEIRALAAEGVKEVLLLGQNVNSYGQGLAAQFTFPSLLRQINAIEGIERIRFMTSHPKDFSDELIAALRDCPKVCKHVHLPLQSGSTAVLSAMNRGYTKEDYLRLVEKARQAVPGLALTTDIIVGFPGETEADNDATIEVVQKAQFANAYTFLYSKRTGTAAALMENQVDENTAKARFQKLLAALEPVCLAQSTAKIGTLQTVLAEQVNSQNPALLTGRTDDNMLVHFPGTTEQLGQMLPVRITGAKTYYLTGAVEAAAGTETGV